MEPKERERRYLRRLERRREETLLRESLRVAANIDESMNEKV